MRQGLLRCGISIQLMTAVGHSLQVLSRPLVNKCLLCINTDRKFWALEFVAMSQFQTHTVQRAERCGAHDL